MVHRFFQRTTMPMPTDFAPALRHLSTPLLAVAESWPFGRQGRLRRRRMSVCPAASANLAPRWSESLKLSLTAPLEGWRDLLRGSSTARTRGSADAGSSGPALDHPPISSTAAAGPAKVPEASAGRRRSWLGTDAAGRDADPLDAPPTRPWAPEPQSRAAVARRRLQAVSADFEAVLSDVSGSRAEDLMVRLRLCTTLQELWHLRPDLFDLVSRAHSQTVAQRRLAQLDQHFPSRAVGL
jgi:hypothetical protein